MGCMILNYLGGEGETDYAGASSVKIRFFNTALPEPVLQYFFSSLALASVLTAIENSKRTGSLNFVDRLSP